MSEKNIAFKIKEESIKALHNARMFQKVTPKVPGIGLSDRILGSDPGFVSWIRIMDSYQGFVS